MLTICCLVLATSSSYFSPSVSFTDRIPFRRGSRALAKKNRVVHHKAMPFSEISGFMTKLLEQSGIAARCLEFSILTACRTNEVIYARPEELDLHAATWTVPASRMKAGKEHRVPLSPPALAIGTRDAGT